MGLNSSRQNLYSYSDINFSFSKKSSNDSSVLYKLSSDVLISPITCPFLFAPRYLHGAFFYKLPLFQQLLFQRHKSIIANRSIKGIVIELSTFKKLRPNIVRILFWRFKHRASQSNKNRSQIKQIVESKHDVALYT